MEGYKEIKGGEVVVFGKEGDKAEGELVDVRTEVGKHKSCMYDLEADGKLLSVWGSTVLDGKMQRVRKRVNDKPGDFIVIVFNGEKKNKEGTDYKDFSVFVKDTKPAEKKPSKPEEKPEVAAPAEA